MANGSITRSVRPERLRSARARHPPPCSSLGGGDSVVVTNTSASLAYVRFGADPIGVGLQRRHAGDGERPDDAGGEQPRQICRGHTCCLAAAPCCSPAATDPISDGIHRPEKTDIRRFCGYPAYGAASIRMSELAVLSGLWVAGIPHEQPV